MDLRKYKHSPFSFNPNKNKIKKTVFYFESLQEFNDIYKYAKANFFRDSLCKRGGVCNKIHSKYRERYYIMTGNQYFEMIIICSEGCYRFILKNKPNKKNTVSGQQASREFYKFCDKYSIDLSQYEVTNGLEVKQQIESPHLEVLMKVLLGHTVKHVYHLDFKSSYTSRIVEAYPELKPMFEEIYSKRHEDNNKYKHVLTNSVGCFQSEFCVDFNNRRKTKPYVFAKFALAAINGTRAKIEDMIKKLNKKGMTPILTNTDGIWYYSDKGAYHDKDEGTELCQWENDHNDCLFLMTSVGSYQYQENGKCHSVVRGLCNLDVVEPNREKWKFGDILNLCQVYTYKFDEELGVIKVYDKNQQSI